MNAMRLGQQLARRLGPRLARRWLPAPSASWDPSRKNAASSTAESDGRASIHLTVELPEDAVLETRGKVGQSIMDVLEAADLSDVWPGGACGGACNVCAVSSIHPPVSALV